MRGRLVLLSIIVGLWVFLFIFQNYFNTLWALVALISIMGVYSVYIYFANKHRVRVLKKHPVEVNQNYKPFITIMIPCHNEGVVIHKTVENITAVDYDNYELILIDDRSDDNTAEVIRPAKQPAEKKVEATATQAQQPAKHSLICHIDKKMRYVLFLALVALAVFCISMIIIYFVRLK